MARERTVWFFVERRVEVKRLSIELALMKQSLWRIPGEREGGPFLHDEGPKNVTDSVRGVIAAMI